MRLSTLITTHKSAVLHGPDCAILGVTADSRKVQAGFLFIAIPGTKQDGRRYIAEALQRGAVAVLLPEGEAVLPEGVSVVTVPAIRAAVSSVAAAFYPRQPETIVAVTGTSGKTSTAQFVREIWAALGHQSASIGTLGLVTSAESRYGSLTTPDALSLHALLDECAGKGITHLALEASSHGLELNRLDHVRLKAGGFTNLSRDHLDYHETLEKYLAAKRRLFESRIEVGGAAVLNADVPVFESLAACAHKRGLRILSYGQSGREILLRKIDPQPNGQRLSLEVLGKKQEVLLPVMGQFQVWNALCALGLVIGSGAEATKATEALTQLSGVAGRLQWVGQTRTGGTVFVDYAHKPDALENVLKALRPHVAAHAGAKLGVVFGCGGNRDAGKRPIMGAIAQRLADWVIVTDDNPREEDPALIRQEVLAGCQPDACLEERGDRAEAIAAALQKLGPQDVLVIAGKGHETGQIIGDKTYPFDDAAVVRAYLVA